MIYRVNVHNFHSEFVDQYLLDQHGKTNLITHGTGKNPLFGIKLFFLGGLFGGKLSLACCRVLLCRSCTNTTSWIKFLIRGLYDIMPLCFIHFL